MAVDPRIALGVQPMQLVNPMDVMQNVQQLRAQRMENEQRETAIRRAQAAEAEQAALNAAAQPGGTLDDYLARVTAAGYGRLVPLIRKQWGEADEAGAKAKQARAQADAAEADYFGGLAARVKSWEAEGPDAVLNAAQLALQHAKQAGHDVSPIERVLTQNPAALPQVLDALIQGSKTQRELLDKERGTGAQVQNAATTADKWNTEKPGVQQSQAIQARTAAASELAAAPSKEAYTAAYSRLAPTVAAAFPPPAAWTPQTTAIVQRIGMTADQQADNAGQVAARAEAARHNRAMEANAARTTEKYEWATAPDGSSKLLTPAEIRAQGASKPLSAAESMDARKFKKAEPALRGIAELSERINTQQGLLAKMAGGAARVAAKANYDDDVAEYQALIQMFTPMVARALGHTGVLTELDVQSVKDGFQIGRAHV